jgi:hypothetical protein
MMAKFRLLGMNCSVEGPFEALLLAPFLKKKKKDKAPGHRRFMAVPNST